MTDLHDLKARIEQGLIELAQLTALSELNAEQTGIVQAMLEKLCTAQRQLQEQLLERTKSMTAFLAGVKKQMEPETWKGSDDV